MINSAPIEVVTASRLKTQNKPPKRDLIIVGGGAAPQLTGVTVKIPLPGLRCGDVTYYEIEVHPVDGGVPWRVARRYRHFAALAAEKGVRSSVPLPPKLWTRKANEDPNNLEERRRGLELWLQGALQLTPPEAIAKFLLLGRCGLAPETPLAPSAPEHEELVYLVEVAVPPGMGPDDLLKVKVPGNEVITISIPWGLVPGTPLKLWWDPMSNSLSVHQHQGWQALRK